jgi:hypothetical protein
MSQPHFGAKCENAPHIPKSGKWSLTGLPNIQKTIWEVKSPCLGAFFILMESSWNVDVQNGLTLPIWTSAAQVMGKRSAGSQTASLTLDHKKSRIDLFPTSPKGMWHDVEKLSTKATTLIHTSSWFEFGARSYGRPKSGDSNPGQFQDSNLGVPGKKAIWM